MFILYVSSTLYILYDYRYYREAHIAYKPVCFHSEQQMADEAVVNVVIILSFLLFKST